MSNETTTTTETNTGENTNGTNGVQTQTPTESGVVTADTRRAAALAFSKVVSHGPPETPDATETSPDGQPDGKTVSSDAPTPPAPPPAEPSVHTKPHVLARRRERELRATQERVAQKEREFEAEKAKFIAEKAEVATLLQARDMLDKDPAKAIELIAKMKNLDSGKISQHIAKRAAFGPDADDVRQELGAKIKELEERIAENVTHRENAAQEAAAHRINVALQVVSHMAAYDPDADTTPAAVRDNQKKHPHICLETPERVRADTLAIITDLYRDVPGFDCSPQQLAAIARHLDACYAKEHEHRARRKRPTAEPTSTTVSKSPSSNGEASRSRSSPKPASGTAGDSERVDIATPSGGARRDLTDVERRKLASAHFAKSFRS